MKVSDTHIGRLLEEISWEGRAGIYRKGGHGRENVITAQVFQALDFLPRRSFLGAVLEHAQGASDTAGLLVREVEDATVKFLPDNIILNNKPEFMVQPDALIKSPGVLCFVEAKRLKRGAFQPEQLAREYVAVVREAEGKPSQPKRQPLLLLVLPEAPPVPIRGRGRMAIATAIEQCLPAVCARCDCDPLDAEMLRASINDVVAYTTWAAIGQQLEMGTSLLTDVDPSAHASIMRIASSASMALDWHRRDLPPTTTR